MHRLQGKTAVVTGGSTGIGFETARQLADQRCFVYLGSHNPDKGREAARQLHHEGLRHVAPLEIDVSSPASVAAARQALGAQTEVLDVLINNAGISGSLPQTATGTHPDVVRQVFDTNFFGTIRVNRSSWICCAGQRRPGS